MANGRHFEKPLNRRISATVRAILTKFGAVTHIGFPNLSYDSLLVFENLIRRTAAILKIKKLLQNFLG